MSPSGSRLGTEIITFQVLSQSIVQLSVSSVIRLDSQLIGYQESQVIILVGESASQPV